MPNSTHHEGQPHNHGETPEWAESILHCLSYALYEAPLSQVMRRVRGMPIPFFIHMARIPSISNEPVPVLCAICPIDDSSGERISIVPIGIPLSPNLSSECVFLPGTLPIIASHLTISFGESNQVTIEVKEEAHEVEDDPIHLSRYPGNIQIRSEEEPNDHHDDDDHGPESDPGDPGINIIST